MTSDALHSQWQAAEQAYLRERETYFPSAPTNRPGAGEVTVTPAPATPEVLAGLAEMRAEAKRLRDRWYQSLFAG